MQNIIHNEWTTFKGKKVTLMTADHQDVSNEYWYYRLILESSHLNEAIKFVLSERFNGQILPYRPHIQYTEEINTLKRKGYLFQVDETNWNIVINEKIIGEINYENQ